MTGAPDICFVATPFLPEHQPALGVSSLAGVLGEAGYSCQIRYLNLDYARLIGFGPSSHIGGGLPVELLLGEMIFAPALWGEQAPAWEDYEDRLRAWLNSPDSRRSSLNLDALLDAARPLYRDSPRVVAAWADEIAAAPPRILGFTTTFQQNVASLALARAVRARVPRERTAILFGGANCEADMGRALADNFPFIDHVVSGEGERVILDLVAGIVTPGAPPRPRAVAGRTVDDMDALPLPDFDDYMTAIAGTEMEATYNLVAESSRGCWWGMKSHCSFCGLNGGTMGFRSKTAGRFAAELRVLKARYGSGAFMLADNIMDMKYLRTLFPELVGEDDAVELFYETKANLRKEQLATMAAAGVVRLQPGIESLSTAVLKLMGKGTTMLQNLQLLKWSEEFRIGLAWNVLTRFPDEPPEAYAAMTALLPSLAHLPPPTGTGSIRLDRFSPHWNDPARYGLGNVRPFWAYDVVYAPLPAAERRRIAYFFECDYPPGQERAEYLTPFILGLARWTEARREGAVLELVEEAGLVQVRDTRFGQSGDEALIPVDADEQALLRRLDGAARRDALTDTLPDPEPVIELFLARKWLAQEGDLLLSLVVDRRERQQVLDRRVALKLEHFGLAGLLQPAEAPAMMSAA